MAWFGGCVIWFGLVGVWFDLVGVWFDFVLNLNVLMGVWFDLVLNVRACGLHPLFFLYNTLPWRPHVPRLVVSLKPSLEKT